MLRDLLPPWLRQMIYTILGALFAIEAIWNIVDDGLEARILATLGVLGFGLAAGNTTPKETP